MSRNVRPPRVGRARALVRYFRDPSASFVGKLFVFFAVAYVVWPADLVPDVPLVGWLDDLGVASLAAAWLGRVSARYQALGGDVVGTGDTVPELPR